MNIEAHKAIGIIDSGVGGLTVVQEMYRQLPHESIVYFGDTARMPYGPRSHEEVRSFTLEIIDFLQDQEIKLVIIACNSASAAGLPLYQASCHLPVVGVIEPGVRAALSATRNRRVGVIGTTGTISSSAYRETLLCKDPSLIVISKACPLFVLLVENYLVDSPEAVKVAWEYLLPFREASIDTMILGCTHYPLMSSLIQETVGSGVKLISSAEETVAEVREILTARALLNPLQSAAPRHRFFVSGMTAPFKEVGSRLLQREMKVYQVVLNG